MKLHKFQILIPSLLLFTSSLFSQKVGINELNPLGEFHVSDPYNFPGINFSGTGNNDMTVDYSGYTGLGTTPYIVQITNAGPDPNLFQWSDDDGATWSANIAMSAAPILLSYGVEITFGNTFGHDFSDNWIFDIGESYLNGLVVRDGNVGIGKVLPSRALDVVGDINYTGNLYRNGFLYEPADQINSLIDAKTTPSSLALGAGAGNNNINGSNVFVGNNSGFSNTSGHSNSFFCVSSGYTNSNGQFNVFNGTVAGVFNSSGSGNVFIGYGAGNGNTTSSGNSFLGYRSGFNNSGASNTFIGSDSGFNNTGSSNTFIGSDSGFNNTGSSNTFIGYEAGLGNLAGNSNTFIGEDAGYSNTSGSSNTLMGENAHTRNFSGSGNTSIGRNSGSPSGSATINTTNCTFLGYNANTSGSYSNSMALGYNAKATGSNQIRIGNSIVGSIGGYTAWSNLSDQRFKKNIRENVKGLNFIKALRPVTYQLDQNKISLWHLEKYDQELQMEEKNETTSIIQSGFLAQEVEAAAKQLGYEFSGVDKPKNDKDFYALRYAEFVVPLVKAVQEQQEMIEELKNENLALRLEGEQLKISNAAMKEVQQKNQAATEARLNKLEQIFHAQNNF